MSEDAPVLDPEEFDITDDKRVREIGDDRYVVSASDGPPAVPEGQDAAGSNQPANGHGNQPAGGHGNQPASGHGNQPAGGHGNQPAGGGGAGSGHNAGGAGGEIQRGASRTDGNGVRREAGSGGAPAGGVGGAGNAPGGHSQPTGRDPAGGSGRTPPGAHEQSTGREPPGARDPPGTRDPPGAGQQNAGDVQRGANVQRGAPTGGRQQAAEPSAAAVSRWLANSLSNNGFDYGFDATVSMDGEVSRHRMNSDDATEAFETLAVWFARNAGPDTSTERTLGLLLSNANTGVELPPDLIRQAAVEHDLSADDSIGDLVRAVRREGHVFMD